LMSFVWLGLRYFTFHVIKKFKICDKKKNRGANFIKEDELLLLEEIYCEKHVIECKVTNKVSSAEKKAAWEKIGNNFNAKSGQGRNINQLRSKFDNLKTQARKVAVNSRMYFKDTGGGPSFDDNLDPIIEAVLKIINFKTVVGLEPTFDCDSSMAENVTNPCHSEAITNADFSENHLNYSLNKGEETMLLIVDANSPIDKNMNELDDFQLPASELGMSNVKNLHEPAAPIIKPSSAIVGNNTLRQKIKCLKQDHLAKEVATMT
ncbi:hypothetical protein NQ314_016858, partial [Rhamnusium bicolor]